MKNLKSLILIGIGITFLCTFIYTLDFKKSRLEFAHSTIHKKVHTKFQNNGSISIVKNRSWDTHFTSHVNLKQKVSSQGIKRFKSQKGYSILKAKSSTLSDSEESMIPLINSPQFLTRTVQNNSSVSLNDTPQNVRFQSHGETSQIITQNTFSLPMQFSGPPSGGGLG